MVAAFAGTVIVNTFRFGMVTLISISASRGLCRAGAACLAAACSPPAGEQNRKQRWGRGIGNKGMGKGEIRHRRRALNRVSREVVQQNPVALSTAYALRRWGDLDQELCCGRNYWGQLTEGDGTGVWGNDGGQTPATQLWTLDSQRLQGCWPWPGGPWTAVREAARPRLQRQVRARA